MKKPALFILLSLFLSISLSSKTTSHKSSVLFKSADFQLSEEAKGILEALVSKFSSNPDFELFIEGHTDSRGSLSYNDTLSLKRTQAVRQYFLEKGVKQKQISIGYRGEQAPLAPNHTAENRENNRRVEITLRSYLFNSSAELEEALSPDIRQKVKLNVEEDYLFEGKNGVKACIPKNSFVLASSEALSGTVDLEITEALSFADFIASGLETKAGDRLLESGGMVKISAQSSSGEQLKIAEGKEILLSIPNQNRQPDMQVYLSEDGKDWSNTEKTIGLTKDYKNFRPFPTLKTPRSRLPVFVYEVEKPKEPKAAHRKFRKPRQPDKHRYQRKIPWYKINKSKIRERQAYNYQKASVRYDRREARYQRLEASFQRKLVQYNKKLLSHKRELREWEKAKDRAELQFRNSAVYLEAWERQEAIYKSYREAHEKEVIAWRTERKAAASQWGEDMDRMGITASSDLNSYVFGINSLGWINVDRLYKGNPGVRQDIVMRSSDVMDEKAVILFKKINSMIACRPNEQKNSFELNNFPMKEEAYILAYKVENQKPMLCFMAMNGSREYELNYMESSFYEIKEILAQFEQG